MFKITYQEKEVNKDLLEQAFSEFKASHNTDVVDYWFFDFYYLQDKLWNKGFKDELNRLKERIKKVNAICEVMIQDDEDSDTLVFKSKTSDFRINKQAIKSLENKRLNMLYKVVCLGY